MAVQRTAAPDGGWGWIVVFGVSLVNLSTRPIEPSFGLLFGDLLTSLSIATTGAAVVVSTYEAVINFSGLFVGPLIKMMSIRKVALMGGMLTGVGLISTYPAANMTHIISTYSIINGLGIGFSSSATFVALNHYFKKRRGHAVGITMTGTGLGLLLMPQAVRYLTEEYDFAGSILILGGFALNSCVGASLLQPVKWHLRPVTPDHTSLLNKKKESKAAVPQINVVATIAENEEDEPVDGQQTTQFNQGNEDEKRPKPMINHLRKLSLIRKSPMQDSEIINEMTNGLKKSHTEIKLDKCEREAQPRKFSEINSNNNFAEMPGPELDASPGLSTASFRRRKGSTISNLSNLDFHGSCLHIHAIKHEVKDEELKKGTSTGEKSSSKWAQFSEFMDLDLLRDPIYLNIIFGLSVFYLAELNFKMIVPFFLADLGHSKAETAFCLSMMAASDIVARVVLPPICDRVTRISRRTMFIIAAVFCAASRSALAETGDWIRLEVILIVSGFFRGATLINFMLVISEYCGDRLDKLPAAFGLHMVAKGIFIAAFGPLIGLIRDATDSFPLCIHAQSGCIMLCAVAWCIEFTFSYCKTPKRSQPPILE